MAAIRPDALTFRGEVTIDARVTAQCGSLDILFDYAGSLDRARFQGLPPAADETEPVIAEVPGVSGVAVVALRHALLDQVPAVFGIPIEAAPNV